MNGHRVGAVEFAQAVDALAGDVHNAPANLRAGRHCDRLARIGNGESAPQAVGGIHSHAADGLLTDVLVHFDDDFPAVGGLNGKSIVDARKDLGGHLPVGNLKMDVHDGTDYLRNAASDFFHTRPPC